MRAGPPIQWSHWKKWGDYGEMFSQSFRLNNSSFVGQWISQWDAAKVYKSHVTVQRNRVGIQDPSLLISFKKNIAGNNPGSSVFTAPVGIHPSLGHTSLQQSQTLWHTHTFIHTQGISSHSRNQYWLMQVLLSTQEVGLPEQLNWLCIWGECMCIREIGMVNGNSVTAVSGFHWRASTVWGLLAWRR